MRLVLGATIFVWSSLLACAAPQDDAALIPRPQTSTAAVETPVVGVLLPLNASTPSQGIQPEQTPAPTSAQVPLAQVKPTVTLVGTVEPTRVSVATRAANLTLRLVGGYGGTPFELSYSPDVWRPVFGPNKQWVRFVHTAIPGCELDPQAGGRGADGELVVEKRTIAGYEFEVRTFFGDDLIAFSLSLPEGYYLFSVDYIQRVPPETLIRCREAVAALLESFRLVRE